MSLPLHARPKFVVKFWLPQSFIMNESICHMSDIMGCFCGNTVWYKRLCYIHILNPESHLHAFFHPAGDFGILAKEFFYIISLLFPVYFQKCYQTPHDIYSLEVLGLFSLV